jgi:hypothetical protein
MRLITVLASLIVVIMAHDTLAQTLKYSKNINKAELCICDNNYKKAVKYYEKALPCLKCPFSLDLFNYFQSLLIINADSEKINNSLMNLVARGYKMVLYMNYYSDRQAEFPGVSKIDTSIFNYPYVKPETSLIIDSFLSEDQRLINLMYENIPDNLVLEKIESFPYQDSIYINCERFTNYINTAKPTECNGGTGFFVAMMPQYWVIFFHYSKQVEVTPFDTVLIEMVQNGLFHPEWYLFIYYERAIKAGIEVEDYYGGPVKYVKYDVLPDTVFFTEYNDYSKKEIKAINKHRKKLGLESYSDYLIKSKYEFDNKESIIKFKLTNNMNITNNTNGLMKEEEIKKLKGE